MTEAKTQTQIQAMNDLIDCIKYSINEGFDDGSHKAKYKLTPAQAEDLEVIESALKADKRVFTYQQPYLIIDSSDCEIPD